MITKELLKDEIDDLENVQEVLEQVHVLIQRFKDTSYAKEAKKNLTKQELQKTLDDFCALGLHDDLPVDSVEDELRLIRKGRRRLWDDI